MGTKHGNLGAVIFSGIVILLVSHQRNKLVRFFGDYSERLNIT